MQTNKITMYDAHLHMGHIFDNTLVQPNEIKKFITRHGVYGGAIMPTARINGNDDFKMHLCLYIYALREGLSPILYVTPQIITHSIELLTEKLNIKEFFGIKIHPDAVKFSQRELESITEFTLRCKQPLFIHTGSKTSCEAGRFEALIKRYPMQIFVLCHARPAKQAFYLLDKYSNVWIDTSFLSIEDLQENVNLENGKRILFGSDYPVNQWYPDLPEDDFWYEKQITDILSHLTFEISSDILSANYKRFKLRQF
ncbi:MAG: amidohydrolase family protein [Muribaculaceae bacterium]|nr:amidohydrolase family protein [Muribaculaceae bacterium]